jgi:hypothetical protein
VFEPPGQACLEPDSSDNTPCAFGFRDGCMRCPWGGICPGGNEVRSQVGCDALPRMLCHSQARIGAHAACICGIHSAICRYFVAFTEVAEVMRCPPPAKTRCLGWDPVSKTTICGSTLAGAPDALCLFASEAAAGPGIGLFSVSVAGDRCTSCVDGYYADPLLSKSGTCRSVRATAV